MHLDDLHLSFVVIIWLQTAKVKKITAPKSLITTFLTKVHRQHLT
jgi:hypothetical protein